MLSAVETGVPAPVLSVALYGRFDSRDRDDFANQLLSAMRFGFGGQTGSVKATARTWAGALSTNSHPPDGQR